MPLESSSNTKNEKKKKVTIQDPPEEIKPDQTSPKLTSNTEKKRGRPKGSKNKQKPELTKSQPTESDSPDSMSDEASNEESDTTTGEPSDIEDLSEEANTAEKSPTTEVGHSREGILYRKGNIVYFLDVDGQPLDKAAEQIKQKGLFAFDNDIHAGDILKNKLGRRRFWDICIAKNVSILNIKTQLYAAFTVLEKKLSKQTKPIVNFTVTDFIANAPWKEVLATLIEVFKNSTIKPILCHDTLIHVSNPTEREFFKNSTLGPSTDIRDCLKHTTESDRSITGKTSADTYKNASNSAYPAKSKN